MRVVRFVGAAAVIAGCGGGGGGDGGTQPPVPVASVTVLPSATTTAICGTVSFTATPRDAQQQPLTRPVTWSQTNALVLALPASGATVVATGIGVGTTSVTATSTVASSATAIAVTGGGAPTTASVATVGDTFSPSCVTIAAGGSVTWTFNALHNVSWQSGGSPTGGNIPDQASGTASRTFPIAGNFAYTCTLHAGMNGRVVVQ